MCDLSLGNTHLMLVAGKSRLTAITSVAVSAREAILATLLMANEGCVLSKDELMAHIYDDPDPPFEKALDLLLLRLRRKLVAIGSDLVINSRYGIGWYVGIQSP